MMHSWKHCQERHLKDAILRAKIMVHTNPDYKLSHPNEVRAAVKDDYTELIIRVKKEYQKYLHYVEVPQTERPKRLSRA